MGTEAQHRSVERVVGINAVFGIFNDGKLDLKQ
jgi:hypothetical protein